MRRTSDGNERLQGALAAIDDALFGTSPKDKFDLDRTDLDRADQNARATELKTLNQRFQRLDEFYNRAVAEIKALRE
jgi:hypothetical protein